MTEKEMTEAEKAELEAAIEAKTKKVMEDICGQFAVKALNKLGVSTDDPKSHFEALFKEKWASSEMLDKLQSLLGPYGMAVYKAQIARGEIDDPR